MKNDKEIIVGLDIGTTKICAIVAKRTENNKIHVLGIGRTDSKEAVRRGMVLNIEKTTDAVKYVIEEASRKSNVDIESIHVGIAGQHIKSIHHRGQLMRNDTETEISRDDLSRLIQDVYKLSLEPGERILHVFPQDYIVDDERGIRDPVGVPGIKFEGNFHIITCQIDAAKNIEKCVSRAGLELADMILEPVASADAVLSDQEKQAGVVLVDIGGGTTDVAIFERGNLIHTAVIPKAGESITQDIMAGCNVLYDTAESLKINFGSAFADEISKNVVIAFTPFKGQPPREILQQNLARIIQARMEDIFEQVFFQIKSSGLDKKLHGGIVLTGGGSLLKHLPQFVEYITGISTRIGLPVEHLAAGIIKEVESPAYATCIGLIMNGMNQEPVKLKKKRRGGGFIRIKLLEKLFNKTFEPMDEFLKGGQNFQEKEG